MSVCMFVCTHACVHVSVCIHVCLCVPVRVSVCLSICLSMCVYVSVYGSVCLSLYVSVCVYVCEFLISVVKRKEHFGVFTLKCSQSRCFLNSVLNYFNTCFFFFQILALCIWVACQRTQWDLADDELICAQYFTMWVSYLHFLD